jgi:hypothetical protein
MKFLPTFEGDTRNKESSIIGILVEYTKISTIQGLNYITQSYQTGFGKIFWSLVVLFMVGLACYWCITLYAHWIRYPGVVFKDLLFMKSQ